MKKTIIFLMVLCISVSLALAVFAAPVPSTGVTQCYDDVGYEIPCPSPSERFYGQDGNFTINPPFYTKLDSSGNALSDSATDWSMVQDNVTGLIWEVKKNKDGRKDYGNPHDADNVYTWYDPADPYPGRPGEGTDTDNFLNALNEVHFGGYSDWRLPTIKELASLVDYSIPYPGPSINTTYFPNTAPSSYWSSTNYAYYTVFAWLFSFFFGYDYNDGKYYSNYVRAVRGGHSSNTFVDNGDGTVTDTATGLMWQKETARDERDNYDSMSWEDALVYCESPNLGYTDWRLPTIKELRSHVDYTRFDPAIDTTYFPHTAGGAYWSSTTYAADTSWAGYIDLQNGNDRAYLKSYDRYVRCVRGGQNRVLDHLFIFTPTQGSFWNEGDVLTINWETAGLGGDVLISISREGGRSGMFETIIARTPNNGSYDWTVTGPTSVNCVLRITPLSDPDKGTTQGFFTVMAPGDPTLYVNGAGVCGSRQPCYDSIQAAIDAAADEDFILVSHGEYYETIVLDEAKSLKLLCGRADNFGPSTLFSTANGLQIDRGTLVVEGLRLAGD